MDQMVIDGILLESYDVIKSNELVQQTRYDLNVVEQKIILYAIQKIRPEDQNLYEVEISLREFCLLCGINAQSGKNFENIKHTLKTLADKSFWLQMRKSNGQISEKLIRWVADAEILPGLGIIRIKLHDELMPYLLNLKNFFTVYAFKNVLQLKSKYSLRLYELFKSYQNLSYIEMDIEDLKKMMSCEHYTQWSDVKRRVVDKSIKEINTHTDLYVTYTTLKESRRIVRIGFDIQNKEMNTLLDSFNSAD